MHTFLKSKTGFLALLAPCFAASCAPEMSEGFGSNNEDLESTNGWAMNGWAMNGLSMNGLSLNGFSMNGLGDERPVAVRTACRRRPVS